MINNKCSTNSRCRVVPEQYCLTLVVDLIRSPPGRWNKAQYTSNWTSYRLQPIHRHHRCQQLQLADGTSLAINTSIVAPTQRTGNTGDGPDWWSRRATHDVGVITRRTAGAASNRPLISAIARRFNDVTNEVGRSSARPLIAGGPMISCYDCPSLYCQNYTLTVSSAASSDIC